MGYLLSIVFFILSTLSFVVIFNRSFGKCLPLSFMTVAFLLFFSQAIFKTFSLGIIAFLLFCLYGTLYCIINLKRKPEKVQQVKTNFFSKGLIVFIILYIIIFIYDYNRMFSSWDEWSHWGIMIKEMLRLDKFYSTGISSLLVHKDYPPIVQLYELFFVKVSRGYSEVNLIRSLHLLELSFFIPAICGLFDKKEIKIKIFVKTICIILSVLLMLVFFDGHGVMNSIYIDYILAIVVAYILYSIISEKDDFSLFNIFNLSLSMSFLLLVKQMGLPLYLMCVFLFVVKNVIRYLKDKIKECYKDIIKKTLICLIFIIIIPSSIMKGWDIYVENLKLEKQFNVSEIKIMQLIDIVKGRSGESWQQQTANSYINAILSTTITTSEIKLSYVQCAFIGIIITYLIFVYGKEVFDKKIGILTSITLIIGAIGYAFVMLCMYVFLFGEREGTAFASFNRYMPTFIIIITSLDIMLIAHVEEKKNNINAILILVTIFLLINSSGQMSKLAFNVNRREAIGEYRIHSDKILQYVLDNESVFILSQDKMFTDQYFTNYYLDNIYVNSPNTDKYVWEVDKENEEDYFYSQIYDYLLDYDYLYVSSTSQELCDKYKFLFGENKPEVGNIYKIKKENPKEVLELIN